MWSNTFEGYQGLAKETAIYPDTHKITYPLLGLVGEVGEFSNKYKKVIRDGKVFSKEDMEAELGDILWYLSAIASDAELNLESVATKNILKLQDRQERDVLGGSGDNR